MHKAYAAWAGGFFLVVAALCSMAVAAQDKYTLQVPNGLPFSDFRGYEDWEVVSIAQTEEVLRSSLPTRR